MADDVMERLTALARSLCGVRNLPRGLPMGVAITAALNVR